MPDPKSPARPSPMAGRRSPGDGPKIGEKPVWPAAPWTPASAYVALAAVQMPKRELAIDPHAMTGFGEEPDIVECASMAASGGLVIVAKGNAVILRHAIAVSERVAQRIHGVEITGVCFLLQRNNAGTALG